MEQTVTRYVTKRGLVYTLQTPAIAKGGEGSIYQVQENPGLLAKIFHEKMQADNKRRKIETMVNLKDAENLRTQAAWPVQMLYQNGYFAGYLMERLDGYTGLGSIYASQKSGMSYSDRIRVCLNLCAAMNVVHEAGQVCGDLNPNNIMVNRKNGMVKLVDTDSYHIMPDDRSYVYRCEVGMPDYLPPELLTKLDGGKSFRNLALPTFTIYSDRFALGVLIFSLLMNGCHPFACAAADGDYDIVIPQIMDSIKAGRYHFEKRDAKYVPPQYAPPIQMLPATVRQLFLRCFTVEQGERYEEERPTETEWYNALLDMRSHLIRCSRNAAHIYPQNAGMNCPWCQIQNHMKGMLAGYKAERSRKNQEDAHKNEANKITYQSANAYQTTINQKMQNANTTQAGNTSYPKKPASMTWQQIQALKGQSAGNHTQTGNGQKPGSPAPGHMSDPDKEEQKEKKRWKLLLLFWILYFLILLICGGTISIY